MTYERTVGKAYARAALRSCLVAAVGLVMGVALVGTVLWIAGGRDASAESYRPLLALAVPMLFIAAAMLLAVGFVALRNRRLDRAFEWLGLRGHQVGGVMRGWHGEYEGRSLDVWFRKGPTLELYLGCECATRGGIGRRGSLGRRLAKSLADREPLAPTPPQVEGCIVFAEDETWMRRWLGHPRVGEAIGRLLEETPRVSPMLSVSPNALHYLRRFGTVSEVNEQNAKRWLEDLVVLARAVDDVGPSATAEAPTSIEEWGRTRRGRRFLPRFIGCSIFALFAFWLMLLALFYWEHYT